MARNLLRHRDERAAVDRHLARLQRDPQLVLSLFVDPADRQILEALPLAPPVGLERLEVRVEVRECAVVVVVARLERHAAREQRVVLLAVVLLAVVLLAHALVSVEGLTVGAVVDGEQLTRAALAHRRLSGEVEAALADGGVAPEVDEDVIVRDDKSAHAVHPWPARAARVAPLAPVACAARILVEGDIVVVLLELGVLVKGDYDAGCVWEAHLAEKSR